MYAAKFGYFRVVITVFFCFVIYLYIFIFNAFSALTLLIGRQEEHSACKNGVMRCWCGYLSGAKCRLLAYGQANANAIPKRRRLLPHLNPNWFYLSRAGLPRFSFKRGRNT